MTKTYCDRCGKEIKEDANSYTVGLHSFVFREIFKEDWCESCVKKAFPEKIKLIEGANE